MGYDPFSAISLAQVNVLCIPAREVTTHKFDEFLRALGVFNVVSLKHVTSTSQPSKFKDGYILLKVGRDVYQQPIDHPKVVEYNSKPQVVIGFLDGEASTEEHGDHYGEWLASVINDFQQSVATLNDAAVSCLIAFGGSQVSNTGNVYFVDLEGDGPSLFDAVQGIVDRLQQSFEALIKSLRARDSVPTADEGDSILTATKPSDQPPEGRRTPLQRSSSFPSNDGTIGLKTTEAAEDSIETLVLEGQLSLQGGQWPEALRCFSEAASAARNTMNHLLHTRALEGSLVCMLLYAWANLDFNIPQICYPVNDKKAPVNNSSSMIAICAANRSTSDSPSSGRSASSTHTLTVLIPQLLNTIISLYERNAGIRQDSEASQLLCQARVRWGNLLLLIRNYGSVLRDAALQCLVEGNKAQPFERPKDVSATALILHVKALTKLFVDAALEAQYRLSTRQAAVIQIAIASSLSVLGVERKQVFHLREFLYRLGPALIEARRIGAAEAGMHPSAGLPSLTSVGNASTGVTRSGVQALLDSICESYGLPRPQNKQPADDLSLRDQLREALVLWSIAHQAGDIMMKVDILSSCVEVSDAIPDLRCSLNLMGRLLQVSIARPILLANDLNTAPLLPVNDQSQLISNIQKAVGAATKYGITNGRARYWDKCLVRHIQPSEEPSLSRLMPHTAQDLSLASKSKSESRKDPFIFNAFAKAKPGAGQSVIVAGEHARFDVVLQNPLQVDVEIEDITLTATGCAFEPDRHNIVLGPLCSQVFTLTGTAQETGDLLVTGCRATVLGCYPEEFLIVSGDWKAPRVTKHLAGSSAAELSQAITLPEIKEVSLKATAPLPKLSIASISLLQQSVMLLEGEKTSFTFTLQNDSDLDADFILLTFEDSVTRRLEEALGNKDLLPADLYEIQNQIATRPVIRTIENREGEEVTKILAHKQASFLLELFGRPGLTDVTIIVDYAHLGRPREDIQESFYTRQLRHRITTTINGSVDIPRCSILPLKDDFSSRHGERVEVISESLMPTILKQQGDTGSQCLLLLDVRNIWPNPLEVEFQAARNSNQDKDHPPRWANAFTVSDVLQPGQMTRLILTAPRILHTNPYEPIPSLDTKRQFVVSASKMSIEAEGASRESFWYRERLLACVRATWKEQNGSREGQVDMRKGIRLNSRMIDALKIDLVEISFSLKIIQASEGSECETSDPITQIGDSHFSLARNTFACLVASVHNRSTETLRLLLRLQPSLRNQPHNIALDLSKRFAWTGVLQRALHSPLEPDDTRRVELGVIALAEGEYEISGTAEEIKSRSSRTGTTAPKLGSGAERRIWHARRPCWIDATDAIS